MFVGLTVASCGLLTPTTSIAEVVFDSIDFEDLNWSYGGVLEFGSEIELSGSDRVVTRIEFLVSDVSSPRNVQLAIYSMDGPDGEPGTVLGTSNFVPAPLSEDEILAFSGRSKTTS